MLRRICLPFLWVMSTCVVSAYPFPVIFVKATSFQGEIDDLKNGNEAKYFPKVINFSYICRQYDTRSFEK